METIWKKTNDEFPELVRNYHFSKIILNEKYAEFDIMGKLYAHRAVSQEDVYDYIRDMTNDEKVKVINSEEIDDKRIDYDELSEIISRTVEFIYLILATMDIDDKIIYSILMDNIIGTHLDINDRKNHALLVISAFFRLCIVNKDTGMLTFLFKTLLKQVPYSLNHLINAFLEHIELKSQLENIEWLADFVAKKLSLDILNTYYTLFSAALQAYDEAKRVRFVENLALWVSNREGTSIETTFKIIMDHSTNTITVNNYTIRQNLHPFFKGFSNAGVSYDVIRNYSEDGEDWYTEKILSVPMFKQLYHLSDER